MSSRIKSVLPMVCALALGAVATNNVAIAGTIQQHVVLDAQKNYGLGMQCDFAETGIIQQTGSQVCAAIGCPPGTEWLIPTVVLSKGSGRCVAIRKLGSAWTSKGMVTFVHRIVGGTGAVTSGSCSPIIPGIGSGICLPKPAKGGPAATGFQACWELSAADTSDGKPRSVVVGIGAGSNSGFDVQSASCSSRGF